MQVVTCREPGTLVLENREMPQPAPGEALVRIRRVGVCGTDYHILQGTQPYLSYPRVMGHELAGTVKIADTTSGFAPGTPVCIMPHLFCGHCAACVKGKTNCCVDIQVLGVHRDGGLAELLAVEPRYLIDASGLTLDQAAMVEFLSIGYHAVRRGTIATGDSVLVVGAGPIGMAVTLFAQ